MAEENFLRRTKENSSSLELGKERKCGMAQKVLGRFFIFPLFVFLLFLLFLFVFPFPFLFLFLLLFHLL